jgi:hypothetical protein
VTKPLPSPPVNTLADPHDEAELHEDILLKALQKNTTQAREELKFKKADLKFKRDSLQFLMDGVKACTETSPNNVLDARKKLLFHDRISNLTLGTLADDSTTAHCPITISSVALELGITLTNAECSIIGKEVKKRYMQLHGKPPSQHSQFVDGAVRMINSYTDEDKNTIVDIIKDYHDRQANPEKYNKRRKLVSCNLDVP